MSHFHRPGTRLLKEPEPSQEQTRSPFADVAGRFANWIAGMDRVYEPDETDDESDPLRGLVPDVDEERRAEPATAAATAAGAPVPAPGTGSMAAAGPAAAAGPSGSASRFPVAPLGYNRAAVDEHLEELESELGELSRELAELRSQHEAPMSVTEELERIGEQTASILVVAHDKASETTRRAQEQAERCIADAAANAVAITEEAKQRLRELDNETDSVWRERERLLEDVRAVSAALAALADQASERFPAAEPAATSAFPAVAGRAPRAAVSGVFEREATRPFTPVEEAEAGGQRAAAGDGVAEVPDGEAAEPGALPGADPGDTASWLAGFEPPEPAEDD